MGNTTRNFHAHGGSEWVIGGKLTFLPGATVEGGEGLFDQTGANTQLPNMPASTATTIAALKEELNILLAAMKSSGLMAPDEAPDE